MHAEHRAEPTLKHGLTDYQLSVLRRFAGGAVGGVLLAINSHPLDTVKARVQRGVYPSIGKCIAATWRNEGIRGFYRGVTPPIIFGGVFNSILLSLNQFMNNIVAPAGHDPHKPLPLSRTAAAAILTAPLYVLTLTPVEKIKVQLQVQGKGGVETAVTGPISCVRSIIRNEGAMGLLSGYVPTVVSRFIGLPFYFMGFQASKDFMMSTRLSGTRPGREVAIPMLSGVIAGLCFWTSNYPCDYIKTQMQASRTKLTAAEAIRATYKAAGVRGFYKGFAACLLRSAPANASMWFGVDFTTRYMAEHGW